MSENNNLDKCADCPVRFAMRQRSNSLQAQYDELQAMSEEHLLGTGIEAVIEQIETEAGNGIPPTEDEKNISPLASVK